MKFKEQRTLKITLIFKMLKNQTLKLNMKKKKFGDHRQKREKNDPSKNSLISID